MPASLDSVAVVAARKTVRLGHQQEDGRNSATMLEILIYGKIIIDSIGLHDGTIVRGVLGGGGPQATFGARLWTEAGAVGLLSRAGTDLESVHRHTLEDLAINLDGIAFYDDLPTLRGTLMAYDSQGYMIPADETSRPVEHQENWGRMLSRPLALPPSYRAPRVVHLVTEYADELMVVTALALREQGALVSLEPLIDCRAWSNRAAMVALLRHVDVVTPDWPSASRIAGSTDPRQVVAYWSHLGPQVIAVRHGQHGSYVWDGDRNAAWHIPAVPVTVVDPTGAGNSYGGGLCAGWLETGDARTAATFGAVAASFLVERVGLAPMAKHLQAAARDRLRAALPTIRPL